MLRLAYRVRGVGLLASKVHSPLRRHLAEMVMPTLSVVAGAAKDPLPTITNRVTAADNEPSAKSKLASIYRSMMTNSQLRLVNIQESGIPLKTTKAVAMTKPTPEQIQRTLDWYRSYRERFPLKLLEDARNSEEDGEEYVPPTPEMLACIDTIVEKMAERSVVFNLAVAAAEHVPLRFCVYHEGEVGMTGTNMSASWQDREVTIKCWPCLRLIQNSFYGSGPSLSQHVFFSKSKEQIIEQGIDTLELDEAAFVQKYR